MIQYTPPRRWALYDPIAIAEALTAAKAAVLSLKAIPYPKTWAEKLQAIQLKREVAGTSKIEGADFTDRELDAALSESPEELRTRSQRQAAACARTYRWIAELPRDRPIDGELIARIHGLIVTGADTDRCPPGRLRGKDENVTFGTPRHRGAEGGDPCARAFAKFCDAIQTELKGHDLLVQALAVHYHFAAMHPFLDGNGRTARALEALMLQRAGLRDTLFISMSNYYYEEKASYLGALAEVRRHDHDLTPFLVFGLTGIAQQCHRLLGEIKEQIARALYRNMMYDLFNRLLTTRKRVIAERQIEILKRLLESEMTYASLEERTLPSYARLKTPDKAFLRDINHLIRLRAIEYERLQDEEYLFRVRLQWPTEITETEFFKLVKEMPKAKTYGFLP